MKFLLIGNGFIAPKHKEAIKEIKGEIAGVVDIDQGEHKWKEAIKQSPADCVVILTPNDLHFEMAKLAAENGKIVLCEKPLAIKSEHIKELASYPAVFTVLQLRYHPDIKKIKAEAIKPDRNEVEMDVFVHRNEDYYNGWKGKKERSGGLLFNLGIHYFDLLLYLLGEPKKAVLNYLDDKTGKGTIKGNNYVCNFSVSTAEPKNSQRRIFKINGKQYNFCSQDNLCYENLHHLVYQDLLNKKGVSPQEELKSVKLIEDLYKSYITPTNYE